MILCSRWDKHDKTVCFLFCSNMINVWNCVLCFFAFFALLHFSFPPRPSLSFQFVCVAQIWFGFLCCCWTNAFKSRYWDMWEKLCCLGTNRDKKWPELMDRIYNVIICEGKASPLTGDGLKKSCQKLSQNVHFGPETNNLRRFSRNVVFFSRHDCNNK